MYPSRLEKPVTGSDRDWTFGPFRLSRNGLLTFPSGREVQLTRRLALPLTVLAAAPDSVVPKARLVELCWPASDVGEQSLSRAIADLRKLFRREQYELIESVYGIGYRLTLPNARCEEEFASRRAASFRYEAKLRVHDRRRSTLETAEHLFRRAIEERASLEDWVGVAGLQVHKVQLGYARGSEAYTRLIHAIEGMEKHERAPALAFRALASCWLALDFEAAADLASRGA